MPYISLLEVQEKMELEVKGSQGYKMLFHSREHDKNKWLSYYSVTLIAPSMEATVRVDNAPYGVSPVNLFSEISEQWKGWEGEKSWGSLEGEFNLSVKNDSVGHVIFFTSVQTEAYPQNSKMVIEFEVELGQLEYLKKQAVEFFK